ncbi:MAG: TetR/AcrR family transcriptional regulator [Microthrixaceae bacterium]
MPGDARDTKPTDDQPRGEVPTSRDPGDPRSEIIDLSGDGGQRIGEVSPSHSHGGGEGVTRGPVETDRRSTDRVGTDQVSTDPVSTDQVRSGRIGSGRDNSVPDGDADGNRAAENRAAENTDVGTRERIVQAAADVFLQKGFTGTRVVDIARRAGYTSGALYGYFDSRAELLAEAVARGSSQMLSRLLGADNGGGRSTDTGSTNTGSTVGDPLAVLQSALEQIASPIDESDQMLLDGIALAHREPVAGDRLAQTVEEFRLELAHADKGGLGEDAADMLVVLVLGITAARALGWHDPPSQEMREHIAQCLLAASESAPEVAAGS